MNAEAARFVSDLEGWGSTGWRILAAERSRRCDASIDLSTERN